MMSFDAMSSSMMESMTSGTVSQEDKLPLKRLGPTIQRFTKIALPTDLARLSQHKKMITRYKGQEDWDQLNTEQINARLTVQQLKANLREMDKARCQIREEDLPALDERVNPLKEEAVRAVAAFIEECGLEVLTHTVLDGGTLGPEMNNGEHRLSTTDDDEDAEVLEVEGDHDVQSQIEENERLRERLEETKKVEETWNKLRGDLEDVTSIIQDFAEQVKSQKEMTDRIEENIDTTHTHVQQGTRYMIQAAKLKTVFLPLTGAVVGAAAGGPLGLMIGYKVGAAAALGGGALGFVGARVFRRRGDSQCDDDLNRLAEQRGTPEESNTEATDR